MRYNAGRIVYEDGIEYEPSWQEQQKFLCEKLYKDYWKGKTTLSKKEVMSILKEMIDDIDLINDLDSIIPAMSWQEDYEEYFKELL